MQVVLVVHGVCREHGVLLQCCVERASGARDHARAEVCQCFAATGSYPDCSG